MAVIITSQDPFHEVSPDSNGLFHECTDEEREEAFKKLSLEIFRIQMMSVRLRNRNNRI